MVSAVLPHETAHAVLHGMFAATALPRWANEGMAALAEPPPDIRKHVERLPEYRQAGQLVRPQDLMALPDYPARHVAAFYAQSVSLVAFLKASRGAPTFTRFLHTAAEVGCGAALRDHYGWTFAELERRWQAYAFAPDGVAQAP
jgi:hypothetical protein